MGKYFFNIVVIAAVRIIACVFCLLLPLYSEAQTIYSLSAGKDVVVRILGNSNLNSWTMTSVVSKSHGNFEFDQTGQLTNLYALDFSLKVTSLESGDHTMDKRTYKALKADLNPMITFKLSSVTIKSVQGNDHHIKIKGDLCIAGVTREVVMNVDLIVGTNHTVACSGSKKIKLSDYNIDPPGLMFGIFKVDDTVSVAFVFIFNP
jgi:polyisoprenoid-binding protein YceI